ncbi:MAG TPA: extracellular solute-binding protein [Acidimicrobiales bacterium]|nr:extracellular solute-binding protein [Acidimicrobiales bacterium]
MARRRTGRIALLVALAALVLSACGGSSGPSITLYNGQHSQLTAALVSAFEQKTGISVRVLSNDGVVLADQILQEGSASPADVYITENTPELMLLQEHQLLAKLSPAVLAQVPAADSSPKGNWVGVAERVNTLAYDPARLPASALPASILDLANPSWAGRIAIAPTDSDFLPLVSAVAVTYGPTKALNWLEGLKRNATLYQTSEAVVAAVNRGAVPAGLVNEYYWYRLRLEVGAGNMHSVLHAFPAHDAGSAANISGAAVLASSGNKAAADRFVAFLVSRQGQRILAQGDDFEYPIRPGVTANPALPALSHFNPTSLGVATLGDDRAAVALLQQAGLA